MTAIAPSLIPAGTSLLAYNSCDSPLEGGFTNRNSSAKVVTDPQRGQVLEATFPKGMKGGSAPVMVHRAIPSCSTLAVGFDLKLSPNWFGHISGVNKVFFIWIGGKPKICISCSGMRYAPLMAQVRLQDIPGGSRNLPAKVEVIRGQWAHFDVTCTLSGISLAVDGKVSSAGSVSWGGTGFSTVDWNPTYGGTGGVVPATQTQRVDAIAIYGK